MPEPYIPIADDLCQVRIPLPFALNLVNCYLLRGDDGWTVFDTGINTPAGRETWQAAFDALGLRFGDIRQIVLTHTHPDHYGLAGWMQSNAQTQGATPPVLMSAREAQIADITWVQGGRYEVIADFMAACGLPPEQVTPVANGVMTTREMTLPHPTLTGTLNAGDRLNAGKRRFEILHAPGHSDGQLLFYDPADKLILSGDQVLLKITPNIGLWPDTDPDPLARFLASLDELLQLDVRLALPGHKGLISDWSGRLRELQQHHADRLALTLQACAEGATIYEASLHIFQPGHFSHHEWRFAMVEAHAHLEYLRARGKLRREDNGVRRYRHL
jgi:glyoxylase-like metal-dependent hydrolase (beta-lactamase superfamily II)